MGDFIQASNDASWRKFDRVFNIQQIPKTPSMKKYMPAMPQAPKKVKKSQIYRDLKPRKLTYENEDTVRTEEKSNKVCEDSGIVLWATTSSSLRMKDVDKENRPESEDVVSNSQSSQVEPGSLRDKLNQWMDKMNNTI